MKGRPGVEAPDSLLGVWNVRPEGKRSIERRALRTLTGSVEPPRKQFILLALCESDAKRPGRSRAALPRPARSQTQFDLVILHSYLKTPHLKTRHGGNGGNGGEIFQNLQLLAVFDERNLK